MKDVIEMAQLMYAAAKAYIVQNQQYLVVKRTLRGKYELPGGRLNFGESFSEALQRELTEELGKNHYQIGTLLDTWQEIVPSINFQNVGVIYRVTIPQDAIIELSDEHIEYAWLPCGQSYQLIQPFRERLARWSKEQWSKEI